MGTIAATDFDAHLRAGGIVVAASDRAARAALGAFQRARRGEGREAWIAPRVFDWQSFVRAAWQDRTSHPRLILNALQEQSVWERIIRESGHSAALLPGPLRNLAALAMDAHRLLCLYTPRYLDEKARASWANDAAAFSSWLAAFNASCREEGIISPSRLVLETLPLLTADPSPRPPLLLAGFDRILPAQHELFRAWGDWKTFAPNESARDIRFLTAGEPAIELSACAAWCRQQLSASPQSKILVIAQDVQKRRGEFERAFLKQAAVDPTFRFEFSLGVPLSQTAPVRAALMLLRWLDGALTESELDWLVSTPYAASISERAALQKVMRARRNRGLQRPLWELTAFLNQPAASSSLPGAWTQRLRVAQTRLRESAQRQLSPLEWAEIVPQLLEQVGWLGASAPTSSEFQVVQRWLHALEACGSLGFDGRRVDWHTFLSDLLRTADETLYAPESEDAPILIAGPAESAGIAADAIWFLGADDNSWPAGGEFHPLLPFEIQRQAKMPHSSPQVDWDLAHAITTRLLASAPEVTFSYARTNDEGVEVRPSRLVAEMVGPPLRLPAHLIPATATDMLAVPVEDAAAIPFHPSADGPIQVRGGAALLTAQSQCPFKAFANGRLNARTWDPAQAALTPPERGQLLHQAMHSIWGGPPNGIRSRRELQNIADLEPFVATHVRGALSDTDLARVREDMPARYLDLEAARLTRLIAEWLRYERARVDFEVVGTEIDKPLTIAGLSLNLRLDRLDRLTDHTLLVIDYKTGDVSPNSWDLPRPEDVQLPLYAGFGIDQEETLGGLVFAKLRAGDVCFTGRVANAVATLDNSLKSTSSLVRNPMTADHVMDWRDEIEKLARNYLAGRADVDPIDPVKTCDRCGLQTLCRISEREPLAESDDTETGDE